MNLVPYPQSVKSLSGNWTLPQPNVISISAAAAKHRCIKHALKRLGLSYSIDRALSDWVIKIGDCATARPSLPKRAEAYTLVIDRLGLRAEGFDKDGLYWALSTLEQLINDKNECPCLVIRDYPAFTLRYHHDDISRKQVSTVQDFKRIIRHLSRFKIKYYTPYMEDMLFLPSHPDIGKGRGCLTPQEVKAMRKEAAKYNVTIFPTFSLIGHQENLLQLKKYRKYAREVFQEPSSFDPAKKILRPFLKDLIKDVCESFPDSPYFHACFDEIQGLSTEAIIDHANWCAKQIGKYGKQMLMWIDMFKNHDAIPEMEKLADNIVLVEWNYDKPGPEIDAYIKEGFQVSGLAGYNNWCAFMPDFRQGKTNISNWAKVMKKLDGPGYGSSQWGDNGYENARDLPWNLFAYLGEVTWLGKTGPKDFEARFQDVFYGKSIPSLQRLIEVEFPQRKLDGRFLWRHFRLPLSALQRICEEQSNLAKQADKQIKQTEQWLRLLPKIKGACQREAEHIDHFEVALRREHLILKRITLAQRLNRGLSDNERKKRFKELAADIKHCKNLYRKVWLRQNKRPNIEVSLEVYDFLAKDCKERKRDRQPEHNAISCVPLQDIANSNFNGCAGVPIGAYEIDDLPFAFCERDKTHLAIEPGESYTFEFDPAAIKDLHFIYGGQTSHDDKAQDCFQVALYSGEKCVFSEQFKSIEDICCWWAPRGDHMWAGGGLKYTNKQRNSFAYDCRNFHGLMHLQNFALPKDCQADSLVLSANGNETIALFALSLQHPG